MNEMSNEDLVKQAGATVVGTQSGLGAQAAQAELSRRMIEKMGELVTSLDRNNVATERFNKRTLQLTWVMAILALVQIAVSLITWLA